MKFLRILPLLILLFALPFNAYAQVTPPVRGGTGTSTIPSYGQVLVGNANGTYTPTATSSLGISGGGSPATSTDPLMATYVVATGSATSTYAALSVSTALNLLGEYITNLTTWVQAKIDAYLSGGQGITYSSGAISFDCSEVEGTGIDCSGENVTLDASGDWAGTLDGQEGSYYLANGFSTTSADVWKGLRNFYSTTSADYWLTQQTLSAFSTTSADFWKTARDFFSTTSASHFLSQNQGAAFSTTSANAWQNTRNFFSTTSADHWDTTKGRWATTSADYWESTKSRWATTSADYWLTQNRGNAFSTTSADNWISLISKGYFFSTTSVDHWLTLNRGNAFSTTSANYWETQQTARTADDLTNNSIEDLSDVTAITEDYGDLLYWTGSAWDGKATSTLGISWNNLADIPAGFADGTDDTGGGSGTDVNWTHVIAGNYNRPATSTSGMIVNGSSTFYTLKTGSTTIDKLTVSTSSTSTINGSLQLGPTAGDNGVKWTATRNYGGSSSVGGGWNINFGDFAGGFNIYSNSATGSTRVFSQRCDNEDMDTQCFHLESDSDSVTAFNFLAAPNGQGALKWSPNRSGDSNSAAMSFDGTVNDYRGQILFALCSATSTKCMNWRTATGTEIFTLNQHGYLGLASSSPWQRLSVVGNAFVNGEATTTGVHNVGSLQINSELFTDLTGSGLTVSGGALTCATANGATFGCLPSADWSVFNNKVSSTSIDTMAELDSLITTLDLAGASAGNVLGFDGTNWVDMSTSSYILSGEIDTSSELAGILGDETGTGNAVFHTNPSFAGLTVSSGDIFFQGLSDGCLEVQSGEVVSSGAACGTGGGSQTPWTSAINGAGFALNNAGVVTAVRFVSTSTAATNTSQGPSQWTANANYGGNNPGEGVIGVNMGTFSGSAISIHSTSAAAAGDAELLHIEQTNANHANEILKIENASTQGGAEDIYVVSPVPDMVFCDNTDSANDCVEYEVDSHGTLVFNSRNSADTSFERNVQIAAARLGGMVCFGGAFDCPFLTSKFTIVATSTLDLLNVNRIGDTTGGGNIFTIDSTQRVGVATTSPWGQFSVTGTGTIPALVVASSSGSSMLRVGGLSNTILELFANTGTKLMSIVSETATLLGTWDFSGATVKVHTYPAFTYATSTAWTGTTTIPLGPAYTAENWQGVKCYTDTGTVWLAFHDGTNDMNYLQASTTVGSVTLSTNNTFTTSEKRYVEIGNPASSPTKVSCSVDKIVNN